MLHCFTSKSLPSPSLDSSENRHASSQDDSAAIILRSNTISSPAVSVSREFAKTFNSPSYKCLWSEIHVGQVVNHPEQSVTQILQPDRDHVVQALQLTNSNPFNHSLSAYFDHSEQICHHLLILNQKVHQMRSLYQPICQLIDTLPRDSDSLSQQQCNWAYETLFTFQSTESPFPTPGSHNFSDMHRCFSDLKEQVDCHHHKPKSKDRTTNSSVCYLGAVIGFAVAALVARLAGSFYPLGLTKSMQKDFAHIALLDSAARSAYVLHNDLQTIGGLVRSLETNIDCDKSYTRTGIAWGKERHPVSKVVNHLAKTYLILDVQLSELEHHVCRCLVAINRERRYLIDDVDRLRLQYGDASTSQTVDS